MCPGCGKMCQKLIGQLFAVRNRALRQSHKPLKTCLLQSSRKSMTHNNIQSTRKQYSNSESFEMLLWICQFIILLQIGWGLKGDKNVNRYYFVHKGMTIICLIQMIIYQIVTKNVPMKRFNTRPDILMLWMPIDIRIILVVP